MSLQTFLENAGALGSYAGLDSAVNLSDGDLDREISIRFQTVFLPVDEDDEATLEFAAQMFNYNTHDNEDPQNLLLLASSQGTAVQADGVGPQMVYHHSLQPTHTYSVRAMPLGGGRVGPVKVMHEKVETSAIHRHWLRQSAAHREWVASKLKQKKKPPLQLPEGRRLASVLGLKRWGRGSTR